MSIHVADIVKFRNLLEVSIGLNEVVKFSILDRTALKYRRKKEIPLFHLVQCIEMHFTLAYYVRSKRIRTDGLFIGDCFIGFLRNELFFTSVVCIIRRCVISFLLLIISSVHFIFFFFFAIDFIRILFRNGFYILDCIKFYLCKFCFIFRELYEFFLFACDIIVVLHL